MIELTEKNEFAEIEYQGKILAVIYRENENRTVIVSNKGENVKVTKGDKK